MPKTNVCPKCGSIMVKPMTTASGLVPVQTYICESCGYSGTCPEIDIEDIQSFKDDLKKSHSI